MSNNNTPHTPVLLDFVLDLFSGIGEGVIVDCTLGYGGHSEALLEQNSNIEIIGIDRDIEALEYSKDRLKRFGDRVKFIHNRYSLGLKSLIDNKNIRAILADIGVSSLQLDRDYRGFGFNSNSLDMRMDRGEILSAKDVINSYSELELERIFREYGEIRRSKELASEIVKKRAIKSIDSPQNLREIIYSIIPKGSIDAATLPFQALRIEVNRELDELKDALELLPNFKNSRAAFISFHSLEDRLIKNYFKNYSKSCICSDKIFRCECGNSHSKGKIVNKKPIVATSSEIRKNRRSRSAKLRAFDFYC